MTPTPSSADAVVVGAGPNGLVAANALADAGWSVVLVEANETVGGAVRTAEVTAPGFRNDLFSAFYPLAAASPVIRDLHLEHHGLAWEQAPRVVTHVFPDGSATAIERNAEATAAALDDQAAGDGDAWLTMVAQWDQVKEPLLDALFTPIPPVKAGARLVRRLGTEGMLEFVRLALLPVTRLGDERFAGEGPRALLTGNAMHSDLPPDSAGSGLFGWLMSMLAQDVGFPTPRGGAQSLADAMAARFTAAGGSVRTGVRVEAVEVRHGRAVGVRLADGERIAARRAVLADVDAPTLFHRLVGHEHLPESYVRALSRFQWDHPTLKLNWALDGPVPWRSPEAVGAGTVHLGVGRHGFVDHAASMATGRVSRDPFVLLGQMTTADATRSPAGTESVWAYSHLSHDLARDEAGVEASAEAMRRVIEEAAPGFSDRVLAEHVQRPADLQTANSNLVNGAINGGTAHLHQQLVFRPANGTGRPETPVPGLYLAGASAHPGGGVHGACGWNAARSALGAQGAVRRQLLRTAWSRLLP
ncbi:phytoene desaturase family protein [Nocardioides daphniae]|uniref:Pyridine nucleotide-disulfide oxidoreductase domain-containing protein 2 n=1 Tax=Nocardioides daphniae TaxID=402297 RepID=A0A4P7UCR6_9ACTN|nr:NAD(P)/FAD-dependent oxidoreductase [Nocardioides daphniae]QCC76719.1 NAD(P)/FAD-dependent oxidoreductase [Nocardioides daphniae]GGD15648.1 FAD-dependent oxidoreductase [Nocardioides daphniae]